MKRILFITISLVAVALTATLQAQVTPQAVIGNAPSLPTPQQWAANGGHTEEFKAKIAELSGRVNEMQAAAMSAAAQASSRQSQTPPPTQAQTMRNQQQTAAAAQQDYAQQMAMMSQLGITEADMQRMASMNERQIEAFMRQRMAEKGIDPAQFATGGDWEAENRRDREMEAQGQAMIAAQEAQEAYLQQMQITGGKINEAEQTAANRIAALWESRKDEIQKAQADCNQPEEVMRGTMTAEQLESYCRRARSLMNDYRAAAYQIWHEYIVAAQGHLKFLMQYAVAADDARSKMPAMTGNAATDQLQRMSNNAIAVAGQYLVVTASEPE